jgi:hypothetical protein
VAYGLLEPVRGHGLDAFVHGSRSVAGWTGMRRGCGDARDETHGLPKPRPSESALGLSSSSGVRMCFQGDEDEVSFDCLAGMILTLQRDRTLRVGKTLGRLGKAERTLTVPEDVHVRSCNIS